MNGCAGDAPAAQWFRRGPDGHGEGLHGIGLPAALAGRWLTAADFPPLLLAYIGHDDAHRRLLDDFHAWQAVWLLTLTGLAPAQRHALERQATVVESQYRLYPETVDADLIQAARVEARLRKCVPVARETDDCLPAFYIELCPYFNE